MEIESLRRASLAALREKYREVFQEETRVRHREHLFRRIAWRLQALAEGDLSERARGRAHQIARDADLRMVVPPPTAMMRTPAFRSTADARAQSAGSGSENSASASAFPTRKVPIAKLVLNCIN